MTGSDEFGILGKVASVKPPSGRKFSVSHATFSQITRFCHPTQTDPMQEGGGMGRHGVDLSWILEFCWTLHS